MSSSDPREDSGGPALGLADPVDAETRSAGVADDSCPSCDAPGSWTLSRRHRFSPFGGITMLVLAFWALLIGWLTGLSLLPAGMAAALGLVCLVSTRTALVCQVCGFVKPRP